MPRVHEAVAAAIREHREADKSSIG